MTKKSAYLDDRYYDEGELPRYEEVARRYSTTGKVPFHENLIARIKGQMTEVK
jgi:hypothetical protein